MKKTLLSTYILLSLSFINAPAFADAPTFTLPTDTKLVEFNYDKFDTYMVLTKPLHVTDIEFGTDEVVLGKAVGDPVLWKVEDAGERHIMVRPANPNLETSLTVITDKRAYHFTLRSSPEGGKWYQHVAWHYPDRIMKERMYAEKEKQAQMDAAKAEKAVIAVPDVSIDKFYTDYTVTGSNEILPSLVADDGKRTSLKFKSNQDLPAVFIKGNDNKYAMVNYDVSADGKTIVIQRVVNELYLKLGNKEVTVKRMTDAFSNKKVESEKTSFLPFK